MAVSDLTNTTWVWNSQLIRDGSYNTYNINFVSNNTNYTSLALNLEDNEINYNNTEVYGYPNTWRNEAYRTITFIGGTDVTNTGLISSLEENATQQGGGTAGKTQIGTRAITKKMFGTREITKEVVNGVVVYEKAPSGFNVTINWRGSENGYCYYSLDDGTTWVDFNTLSSGINNITNIQQIKFKVVKSGSVWGNIYSTQLGLSMSAEDGAHTSQNYTLTQNITDVDAYITYD